MNDSMKVFYSTAVSVPTIMCLTIAAVLVWDDRDPTQWGWFLAAALPFFFLGVVPVVSKFCDIKWGLIMSDTMKCFYVTVAALPSLFTLIMAGITAYEGQSADVWGWFLFVGFLLANWVLGGTLDKVMNAK